MDTSTLPTKPPAFSDVPAQQHMDDSSRSAEHQIARAIAGIIPFVGVAVQEAIDSVVQRKRNEFDHMRKRIVQLHAMATQAATEMSQPVSAAWCYAYADLVTRFTAAAKRLQQRRRFLFRVAQRIRGSGDEPCLQDFDGQIDELGIKLRIERTLSATDRD